MQDRRRAKRMPVKLSLEIIDLYKQDNVQTKNINAPIEVVDISKLGMAFLTESELPIGYYFNATIKLGDSDDELHSVVQIIRKEQYSDIQTKYGCEFVGMATILSYIFDEYEKKIEQDL